MVERLAVPAFPRDALILTQEKKKLELFFEELIVMFEIIISGRPQISPACRPDWAVPTTLLMTMLR